MINGPDFSFPVERIQPVDSDLDDRNQRERNKKQRVLYQGRSWAEKEEELPIQPSRTVSNPPTTTKGASAKVYPDQVLLEQAQKMFKRLMTLEEKVSQLCFLETKAIYDTILQSDVELLIQTWQIGGLLFQTGNYKRQAYLIERYQEFSKTPLLMANDFLHGLSFYLQGDRLTDLFLSEKRCCDLGKAVMALNRRIGVHVQFDRERSSCALPLNEKQAKMFRLGVHGGQGVVGKKRSNQSEWVTINNKFPFISQKSSSIFLKQQIREIIGLKTLGIFDATEITCSLEGELLRAFRDQHDVFLFSNNITEGIRTICKLVRSGKIREEELDRHVIKILVIKCLFFK